MLWQQQGTSQFVDSLTMDQHGTHDLKHQTVQLRKGSLQDITYQYS
jgi:hypothetical protein